MRNSSRNYVFIACGVLSILSVALILILSPAMFQASDSIISGTDSSKQSSYMRTENMAAHNDMNEKHTSGEDNTASSLDLSKLQGVNFYAPMLHVKQAKGSPSAKVGANYYEDSLRSISIQFNVIRLPYNWEAYEFNAKTFSGELELVLHTAKKYGLYVILDFHQSKAGSHLGAGSGFPSSVLQQYKQTNYGYAESDEIQFWRDFWNNKDRIWEKQLAFMTVVIEHGEKYDNVIAYEILNQPRATERSDYEKIGKYHRFMAEDIRKLTDKMLFFNRVNVIGDFTRQPDLEGLTIPFGINNIVYSSHLYNNPLKDPYGQKWYELYREWSREWDIPVFISEWAAPTEQDTLDFVKAWDEAEFGWTYWTWHPKPRPEDRNGKQLFVDEYEQPTKYLTYLRYAAGSIIN